MRRTNYGIRHVDHYLSRLVSILIPLLLCLCLVILSVGVCKHVNRSGQPPLYDAVSYMQKAKAFWDMVASGHWENPLNLAPVTRPPGTVLMSYPFGFSLDYKGFLARSVLLPLLLFVAALYVAAFRPRMSRTEHIDLATVAMILASLPSFYHFEAAEGFAPTYWGLVDNYLAGVGALAFATGYRAVLRGSWLLLSLASVITGLCIMIKPAGVVVAPVIITLLVILKIANDLNRPGRSTFAVQPAPLLITGSTITSLLLVAVVQSHYLSRTAAIFVASVIAALVVGLKIINNLNRPVARWFSLQLVPFATTISLGTGLLLLVAFKSDYLSNDTFQWGTQAMVVIRRDFSYALTLQYFNTLLRPAFGLNVVVLWAAATVAAIGICVDRIRARELCSASINLLNLALAGAVLVVGAYCWLMAAGLAEVRYYYPFVFVSLILLANFLLNAIRGRRAPYTRSLLYGSATVLFGGLTLMLYSHRIDASWQQTYGVNLTSFPHREERFLADLLLQRARTARHDLKVYAMDLGWDFGAIASDGIAAKILRADEPAFGVSFPVDWQRPSTVHLKDMVASDYILFHTVADESKKQSLLTGHETGNLSAEIATIGAWLMEANEESGLKQLTTGTRTLKQVVDRDLFTQSIAKWAKAIDWRDVFKKENADFLRNLEMSSAPDSSGFLIQ
jgi:hypothetical protein